MTPLPDGDYRTGTEVIRLLDVEGPSNFIDVDRSGGHEPTVGDIFIFHDTLYRWAGAKRGKRVGLPEGVVTATGRLLPTAMVAATAILPDGQIQIAGRLDFAQRIVTVPVVGGTGRYANARGTLTGKPIGGEDSGKTALVLRLAP